jgi:hypothetical protein
MRSNWKTIAFVAVAAVGGLLAGRALAEDEMGGGMPTPEKSIEAHALVKALAGKWDVKSSDGATGTTTYRLVANKTALLQEYETKGGMMQEFGGAGAFKISDDGKSARLWWLSSVQKEPDEYKGTVTDTGYELSQGEGATKVTLKLVKKGEGWEWSITGPWGTMSDTYTKAK